MSPTDFKNWQTTEGICPACETRTKILHGTMRESLQVRGEPVGIEARVRKCESCNELFTTVDEEEENFQKAYRIYRRHHGLLQPEEIQAIREQYLLGQRAFSRLIGWGEITLHRYESGALQDESHNNELLLLKDPKNFQVLFERNKHRLSPGLKTRVEQRLRSLLNQAYPVQFLSWLECFFGEAREDVLSGYRQFDIDRFEVLVHYFCKSIPNLNKTKLNKLLWYSDFLHFHFCQRSITGLVYVHAPYGPVPKFYDYYLAYWIGEGSLLTSEKLYGAMVGEAFESLEEPDLSLLTQRERDLTQCVVSLFKAMSAKSIVELSHKEDGYLQTAPGNVISYEWANTLVLANRVARRLKPLKKLVLLLVTLVNLHWLFFHFWSQTTNASFME